MTRARQSHRTPTSSALFETLEARQLLSTVLVNFVNTANANLVNTADSGDFIAADPSVDPSATVRTVSSGITRNLGGTDGLTIDVSTDTGEAFNTDTGTYADTPILDSYLFARNGTRTVTISGLGEIPDGDVITLTTLGVGDTPQQDTRFTVRYAGDTVGTATTDYDSGELFDTRATFVFTKVAGVDAISVDYSNLNSRFGAFGGFALTTSAPEVQPPIRINAGGGAVFDTDGNLFQADTFFSGDSLTFSTNQDIFIVGTGTSTANDNDSFDPLYQTERYDENLNYEIPVANGLYTVRLHFAEIFHNRVNQRIFDIRAEDALLESDLDIFEARLNAFTPGNFASLVREFDLVEVNDGALSLNFNSSVENAKVSGIEVIPIDSATLAVLPTDNRTEVLEGGFTDTYRLALTEAPAANVVVTFDPGDEVTVDRSSVTFTPTNFDVPQVVTVTAVNDDDQEGTQSITIGHTLTSDDPTYDNAPASSLNVTVFDDDTVEVNFDFRTLDRFSGATTATFGPDGRLYAANRFGDIRIYTLDDNNNVIGRQDINTLSDLPGPGSVNPTAVLGLAFNPFEELGPGDTPTIYVTRSSLFDSTTTFGSKVSTLSGPNYTVLTDVVTGLAISGFDHGVNGLQFDENGDLLIAIGGNTNTGVFDGVFGSDAPESPLTSAILRARITDPAFNGDIRYAFIDPNDPNIPFPGEPDNQLNGEFLKVVDVPGETGIETFAVGLRNPYDIVYTTDGRLFGTDNGPNEIAFDELNLISEDDFLGHPNIPRSLLDSRQSLSNAEYDPDAPSIPGLYTAPLLELPSSTDGIDEYRSEVFGEQLRGQLVVQTFNEGTTFLQRTADGLGIQNAVTRLDVGSGLDVTVGLGGTLIGADVNDGLITIATPVDFSVTAPTAYDINVFRAPVGNPFIISGQNFGTLNDTTVLIGGVEAEITSISDTRIRGTVPPIPNADGLVDVTVNTAGTTSVLEEAFLPIGEQPSTPATVEGRFVFYNNSAFDGGSAAANAADDNALAPDKRALLPGQTATFANYTSYSEGVNGLFVDIANPGDAAALTAADFSLAVANASTGFTTLGSTPTVSVRTGAGVNASDRITLTLPDGAVSGEWLRITVAANENTGLVAPDVFYFGNAVGETGNAAADAFVNVADTSEVRRNPTGRGIAAIDNRFDINRDGRVNVADTALVRANPSGRSPLRLITAPVNVPTPLAAALTGRQQQAAASYVQWQKSLLQEDDENEDLRSSPLNATP